jgi:TRAP-type C4-dicarboxylate transport system substrate-binding protein
VRETKKGERLQGCGVTAAAIAEGGNVPQLGLLELPYLYANNDEADHVLDNIVFDDMSGALSKKGFVLTMWSENGWRSFATTNKPILTPDDLKGVKMRSQESDVHMEMYKAYGAQAVQKPMTEVATALQAGLIDGLDNTPLFIVAGRLNEPLKHMTLTNHIYQPAAIIISRAWFEKLPEDLQKIVLGTRDMTAAGRASIREENEGMMELLRESLTIVELTPEQTAAFAGPAQGTHAALAAKVEGGPEILDKINKAVAAKRAGQ